MKKLIYTQYMKTNLNIAYYYEGGSRNTVRLAMS